MCFGFLSKFVWNISCSKKKWEGYDHKCGYVSIWSTCYSCQNLLEFEFSGHIFEKLSNIKFHENPFPVSRAVPCGRTDIRTDMTKLIIVAFRNFAKAPKNLFKEPLNLFYPKVRVTIRQMSKTVNNQNTLLGSSVIFYTRLSNLTTCRNHLIHKI